MAVLAEVLAKIEDSKLSNTAKKKAMWIAIRAILAHMQLPAAHGRGILPVGALSVNIAVSPGLTTGACKVYGKPSKMQAGLM